MTVYVVVELTVKDPEALKRYSAAAGPAVKHFGGEFISRGAWDVLNGEPAFESGAIISFIDRETAIAWYNSPEYHTTWADRSVAMDCRFRLLG
ncbi:DUF1330 domain-containing protein [Acetobacteraceae bacterium KSS8]|uniref:DUF1330 domain-containing protein n=1 Tax=Endosaccharibacter trunci TaxID=2812733 RepID=A0ABT1WAA8_9PROT|nr:DUF1330 domain-containing protein [Acetobacteraceae bacterium KSS8]